MILIFDEIIKETKLAKLFRFDNYETWIPSSQIQDLDEDGKTMEIPDWMAVEKGLEDYEE